MGEGIGDFICVRCQSSNFNFLQASQISARSAGNPISLEITSVPKTNDNFEECRLCLAILGSFLIAISI